MNSNIVISMTYLLNTLLFVYINLEDISFEQNYAG